jgi:hypothetical protein
MGLNMEYLGTYGFLIAKEKASNKSEIPPLPIGQITALLTQQSFVVQGMEPLLVPQVLARRFQFLDFIAAILKCH